MKKYKANYTNQYSDFVILNLVTDERNNHLTPALAAIKNVLQSGRPAPLSDYLISKLGDIPKFEEFNQDESESDQMTEEEIKLVYFPTGIMRFQILLIELLANNHLNFDDNWNLNLYVASPVEREIIENISYREEFYGLVQDAGINALELALTDLMMMIDKFDLHKKLTHPIAKVSIKGQQSDLTQDAINIDFSFRKYTAEDATNKVLAIRSIDN